MGREKNTEKPVEKKHQNRVFQEICTSGSFAVVSLDK